jgi:hypothetical protein
VAFRERSNKKPHLNPPPKESFVTLKGGLTNVTATRGVRLLENPCQSGLTNVTAKRGITFFNELKNGLANMIAKRDATFLYKTDKFKYFINIIIKVFKILIIYLV